MHHQQQIKWYVPPKLFFTISKLDSILAVANLLADNNITIIYYVQVNSLRHKSSEASKRASKHIWGYHLFHCLGYLITIQDQKINFYCWQQTV